jgi:hypothetical protein
MNATTIQKAFDLSTVGSYFLTITNTEAHAPGVEIYHEDNEWAPGWSYRTFDLDEHGNPDRTTEDSGALDMSALADCVAHAEKMHARLLD